jgi:hypothetical protein
MVSSVSVTSCAASDLACLCTNSAYIDKAIHCIDSSCSPSDAQNSYAYATFACKSAGVIVPSVDSVLHPQQSSAADPPPAATTPAPVESTNGPAAPPASTTKAAPYPVSSTAVKVVPSSSGNRTHTSAVVTFQGAAPKAVGIEKGIVGAVALGVLAILAVGML